MTHARSGSTAVLAALLVLCALLAGCSEPGDPDIGDAGSLAARADLSGQTYVLGGTTSREQQLLCAISTIALESAGASVTQRCNSASTSDAREALVTGDTNIEWQYTGQVWAGPYAQNARLPPDELYRQVARRDRTENAIDWLNRTGFDATYAVAVNGADAARLRLHTISEMANYVRSGQPGTTCVDRDYDTRVDGLRGLEAAYGFTIAPDRLQVLDRSLLYQSTADNVCTFGVVSASNGQVPGLGLVLLEDDLGYHLPYNAAPTVRDETFRRNPGVAAVLNPIAQALDGPTMRTLTSRVTADGMPTADVAREWLARKGFVAGS